MQVSIAVSSNNSDVLQGLCLGEPARSLNCGREMSVLSLSERRSAMPLFIVERNFAEQVELNRDIVTESIRVNTDVDIKWLSSFLSADKKKSYCLYEAPDAEAIREAARRLNMPADTIIEIGNEFRPEMFQVPG
jgi:Protein of unknown function (DUF4242)